MKWMATLALAAFAPLAFSQEAPSAAAQTSAFEVASIKPAAPATNGHVFIRMGGDPGRIDYNNVSLKDVLAQAYKVKRYQISGPAWIETERFDIIAKLPDGASREQVPAMLQNLLAERFKMAVHRDKKELPVYALVPGKGGPKLKKNEDPTPVPPPGLGGKPDMVMRKGGIRMSSNGHMEANGITLASFSDMLSNMLDRPVVDMTGIEGEYDIALDVSPEDLVGMRHMTAAAGAPPPGARAGGEQPPAADATPSASIFTAIQQLGLKLDSRKAPVEFIVVDKAEKVPTEN
jgi:uncharacterized protein (TIGR03435 family)